MIYGLYWKTTGKRYNSNTTSLLFATKKGAKSYIKNQKSLGLNKALVSNVFTGKIIYNLVDIKRGHICFKTLEKDIAEAMVMQSRDDVMGVARMKIKISRPKELFALVQKLYTRIIYVDQRKDFSVRHKEKVVSQAIGVNYKIIKIK